MAQMVKNPPAMQKTWIQSLGWEDRQEKGMATHSGILAWRIPMDRGAWWATVHGVTNSQTRLNNKHKHIKYLISTCRKGNTHTQKSLSHVRLLVTPWTIKSMEFSRNTGVGSHSLLQGIFPVQGSNPSLLLWQASSLPLAPPGKSY